MYPTLVTLFDYTGRWSKPWRDAGWAVIQVDLKLGTDIYKWNPPARCTGVLAAPPCTEMAVSGSKHFAAKDADGRTEEAVRLFRFTLKTIKRMNPKFWILENPVGRINTLIPEFPRPRMYIHPYEFACYSPNPEEDRYPKRTGLWGEFNVPEKKPLTPILHTLTKKDGTKTSSSHLWAKLGGKSERTKELRSTTPLGMSYALYSVNHEA